ncbi:MAG TPA: hypothetical protein VFK85_03920 [Anaeromyxobacteraceae bacterium]|nr:hypothetical protein [Anaeromyxobacteraceae bacterium]
MSLRLAVVVAAVLWAAVLAVVATHPEIGLRSAFIALGFLVFFVGSIAHYELTAIEVEPDGIVVRGAFRDVRVKFDEIQNLVIHQGFVGTLYAVLTRRGLVRFSSLFSGHRELADLLLDRTGLVPLH